MRDKAAFKGRDPDFVIPEGMKRSPFYDDKKLWIAQDELAFIRTNQFPVTEGHVMVIPKGEVVTAFDLAKDELISHFRQMKKICPKLRKHYKADGFNIGWNSGYCGGQSIAHSHMHIMPRSHSHNKKLDVETKGGICRLLGDKTPAFYNKDTADKPFTEALEKDRFVVAENDLAVAIRCPKPVSPGHVMIVPKSSKELFKLGDEEFIALFELAHKVRGNLEGKDNKPDGYNLGFNVGKAAGQIENINCMHLIPRHKGDIEGPRGGICKIVPSLHEYYNQKNAGKDVRPADKVKIKFSMQKKGR